MKKLLFIFLIIFTVFIIYLSTFSKNIYYMSIGTNSLYSNTVVNYLKNTNKYKYHVDIAYVKPRITDIYDEINNNKKIGNNTTYKHALIKADVVTINLNGSYINEIIKNEEYTKKEKYKYLDQYIVKIDNLFQIIREYCKEDIYFLSFINENNDIENEKYFSYINFKINSSLEEYSIIKIDINKVVELEKEEDKNEFIGNEIIKQIKQNM